MAFDGTNPAWCPAIPMTRTKEWRLRVAQFGDGYQQRTLDGINALNRSWSVSYAMKPANIIADMEAYLEAAKGDWFPFQDPATGEMFKVTCDQWQVDWLVAKVSNGQIETLNGSLSAEFVKFNGLGL